MTRLSNSGARPVRAALALLLPLATAAYAGDDDPIVRAERWPELVERERVEKEVAMLRAANTEEMGVIARDALVADGAMAAPLLLKALEKERDEGARERIVEVLDRILGATHTRLLAPSFESKSLEVRTWTMRKAARYADDGLADAARAAWQRLAKQRDKADGEEVYACALLLTSTGDLGQLQLLVERAERSWKESSAELRTVLRGLAAGGEAGAVLARELQGAERQRASAVMRLLAACGTRDQLRYVAHYLDSQDNTLRIDAINACRAIVDGEEPLEHLAVFEAIEMAKAWKERVR